MEPSHPVTPFAEPASIVCTLSDLLQVYGRPPMAGADLGGHPSSSVLCLVQAGFVRRRWRDLLATVVFWVVMLALVSFHEPFGGVEFEERQRHAGRGRSSQPLYPQVRLLFRCRDTRVAFEPSDLCCVCFPRNLAQGPTYCPGGVLTRPGSAVLHSDNRAGRARVYHQVPRA
jgi:hypothetical protein